jgi:hypothetical protein
MADRVANRLNEGGATVVAVPSERADQRTRQRVLRIALVVALLVAPLAIGEVTVRALIAAHRLPAGAARIPSIEVSWTNLERGGPVDILILGDSLARMGISPRVLEERASRRAGRAVSVFNLGTPGAGFPVYTAYVEELAQQGRLPKLAVIGISTVAIQRPDRVAAAPLRSPFGRMLSDCAGVEGFEDVLSCRLESASALWRWRGQSDRLLEAIVGGGVPDRDRTNGITVGIDGFAWGRSLDAATLDKKVAIALRNTPPLRKAHPDVDAFVALADSLRTHGVATVAVLIPYAPPLEQALAGRERGWRQVRVNLLDQLGNAADLRIIRPRSMAPWWTPAASHDARHLSPAGAIDFTEDLWGQGPFRRAILAAVGAEAPAP